MTAATAATATYATQMKDMIANMPDTLNTKKEIDAYLKDAMKNIKIDGNDDKPKKELNAYQQYVKDNTKTVKEQNPSLSGKEVFSLIATMWQKTQNADGTKSAKSKVSKSKKEKPDEEEKAIPVVEEEDKEEKVIDEIAERIGKLGSNIIGTMSEYSALTRLKESPKVYAPQKEMLIELKNDHEILILELRKGIAECVVNRDAGTADFLTGLLLQHETSAWIFSRYLN
jgi:hypothetical protein